jgi:hypothetical protein
MINVIYLKTQMSAWKKKATCRLKARKRKTWSGKNTVLIVESYKAEARVFANILKKNGFKQPTHPKHARKL